MLFDIFTHKQKAKYLRENNFIIKKLNTFGKIYHSTSFR